MENNEEFKVPGYRIDEVKLERYMDTLRSRQNIGGALIGGILGALLGAGIWALITIITEYQIGYMAIGVGFLTGLLVRTMGKGIDQTFGIMGAVFALIGCILGNYISMAGIASQMGMGEIADIALTQSNLIIEVMKEEFGLYDVLFYGLALYAGYKYAFHQVSDEEVIEAAGERITRNKEEAIESEKTTA